MSEMLIFHSFDAVDGGQFLDLYRGSSDENCVSFYPEFEKAEALREYEKGYLDFMRNSFFNEGGTLLILSEGRRYVSALRLIEEAEGKYYLEALETNPDFRKKGYAKELLLQLQKYLKEKSGRYTLTSHVEKTNTASLNTHFAAGFEITADYIIEDGERYDSDYELTYKYL